MSVKIQDYINSVADGQTQRALQAIFENLGEVMVDDSLKQNSLDRDYTFEEFENEPVASIKGSGAAPTGATGEEVMLSLGGNLFECHVLGAGQTILIPQLAATGLDIALDQTENEGCEVGQGITSQSRSAFVVGTSKPFFLKVKFSIANVSGTDDCAVGFRKAEAYQGAIDDYDEMASLNVISGAINVETILNGGDTGTTDTTDTWADAAIKTLEVYVDANGVVTFKIDGVAPTTTATFTFDADEVVVPFIYLLHAADPEAGAVVLEEWECGLQEAM